MNYKEKVIALLNSHELSNEQKEKLESIFPELKESEDGKIRKEMLQIAKESEDSFYMVLTPNKRETLIAWLEKQGEQKPAWSEEDESRITTICTYLQDYARLSGSESRTRSSSSAPFWLGACWLWPP